MIQTSLDKTDLMILVKGIKPFHNEFSHPLVKRCGEWSSNDDGWRWSSTSLNRLSELDLYTLYQICKTSWV